MTNHFLTRAFTLTMLLSSLTFVWADPIVLEVEDFKGPWRKQTNITGFLGTGFCTSNATDPKIATTTMDGKVNIETAGRYAVWTRGYTSENTNRAYSVQLGDTKFPPTHTGSERQWSWQKAGEIDLNVGPATVQIVDAADGFESVDAVFLSRNLDGTPDGELASLAQWEVYPNGLPDVADPLRFGIEASRKLLAKRTDPDSITAWEERAPGLRSTLQDRLGLLPWPEKTPLNANVTGGAERDFYTVENVVFESRPGFYVTANLYIPKGLTGPAPGVVVVPGHAMDDGKNYGLYQVGQLGMVKEGIIVLAYDPIGQGERKLPGFGHNLGYGSLLVGQTNEGYIVWDTIRALDYLTTREEVDADRLGLAGNSGGGENVFYTMPLDDRIKAGTSFSFVCSYDLWLAEGGNHCICNHLPGIVHEMEEFEIIGLNAPRPFLAGNGSEDKIFPVAGHRETIERAQNIYAMVDGAEKVQSVLVPMGHGWSQPLREAGWGWMNKWLLQKGDGSPVPEVGLTAEDVTSKDILCFKEGGMPEGAETVVTLNRKRAESLIAAYDEVPANRADWEARAPKWREAIWDVMGGKPAPLAPTAQVVKAFVEAGLQVETLRITVEDGMEVGAVYARPVGSNKAAPATIFVGGHEEKRVAVLSGYAAEAAKKGPVLVLDPRGMGESKKHENHLTSNSVVLGRPLFAQQVWDLLQARLYLTGRSDIQGEAITIHGEKSGALLGLYAAALEPGITEVVGRNVLGSYQYFLEDAQPQPISLCVPNILKVADIPQIVALAAPTPLNISGIVAYGEAPLGVTEAKATWTYAEAVYGVMGAQSLYRAN